LYLNYGVITLIVIQIGSNILRFVVYLVAWNLKTTRLQVRFDWPLIKQMLRDWRTFALEAWTYDLFSKFDSLALSLLLGEAAVGIYNAAYRVIGVAQIFARSFTRASFPYLARLYGTSIDSFRAISEKSLRYMVALVLPGVVSLSILADRFILLLFDESYTDTIPVFRVMVWVLLFRFVNPYLSFMLFAQGKQQRSLHVILIASVVYVPNSGIIPTWGCRHGDGATGVGASLCRYLLAVTVPACQPCCYRLPGRPPSWWCLVVLRPFPVILLQPCMLCFMALRIPTQKTSPSCEDYQYSRGTKRTLDYV
jgi:O-antigen/teichoic acid export membrane protein